MVGVTQRQSSLFFVAFHRQASLIKDDLLEPIDALLDDPKLLDLVRQALARRHPHSASTGRTGIAPDRVLRCYVLKHIKGWSFRGLEREVRGSLVYRRFTRFDQDAIPVYTNFSRTFAALGDDLTREIHARVVEIARRERVAPGRKLRTDSTVVEANIHHPTDSSLLNDGIRVLTRAVQRLSAECSSGALKVVDHARAAKYRVLEIHRAAKSITEASQVRMQGSYKKLVEMTRGVLRQAEKAVEDVRTGALPIVGDMAEALAQELQIKHFGPLVQKVLNQTEMRVFGGDTHVVDKIVSLFEEHTQILRKGKAHKPTEFGRLVRLDEVESGIVSHYTVHEGRPADVTDFVPAVSQHKEIFGRAPEMASADRGYYSAANEKEAKKLGVKKVAIPARGRLSEVRKKLQAQPWFKRAQGWRAGLEGRIGTLKHRFHMDRARYKGDVGFKRYVGWSVITNNLVAIARVQTRRKVKKDAPQSSPH